MCEGRVSDIRKAQIPYTNIMAIECNDNKKIEMMIHDELLNFSKGEEVGVVIDSQAPNFKEGYDLCGRGIFYHQDEAKKIFSIGGYLVVLWNDEEKYEYGKKYYICVVHRE